mmetsp:Transcript_17545/g.40277  ORF Transcript_17545/g.40277 Transcript_17545/m.40277 type:complete len:103 (+) Transcript_17545:61-369(+)
MSSRFGDELGSFICSHIISPWKHRIESQHCHDLIGSTGQERFIRSDLAGLRATAGSFTHPWRPPMVEQAIHARAMAVGVSVINSLESIPHTVLSWSRQKQMQ